MSDFGGRIEFQLGTSIKDIGELSEALKLLNEKMSELVTKSQAVTDAFNQAKTVAKLEKTLEKLAKAEAKVLEEQKKTSAALKNAKALYTDKIASVKKLTDTYDATNTKIKETNTYLLDNNSVLKENLKVLEDGTTELKSYNVATEDQVQAKKKLEAAEKKANKETLSGIKGIQRLMSFTNKLVKGENEASIQKIKLARTTRELNAAEDSQSKQWATMVTQANKLNRAYDRAAKIKAKEHDEAIRLNRAYDANTQLQKRLTSNKIKNVQVTNSYNAALGKETITYKGVTSAGKQYVATVTKVNGVVTNVTSRTKDANAQLDEQKKRLTKLTLSWATFARIAAVQLIHRAISRITMELREATISAKDFSLRIAEIQTISQRNQLSTEAWAEGLKEVSNNLGIDVLDQAEAAYQALSNQITEGAETFEFLTQASKFAITTVSSSADSVKLLSAALNAYELGIEDTNKVAANFFKTIELGRIRSSELADTWGKVAVPARTLNIRMEDVNASLAFMTINGIKADEAMTLLRNIVLKLIKPSTEMKNLFKELGVSSGEAAIATYGFGGFMAELEKRTKGSTTELGKFFTRQRALTGATLFAGKGLEKYNATLKELIAGEADYAKANEIALNNVGRKWEILGTKTKNFFLDFGDLIVNSTIWWADFLGVFDDIKIAQDLEKEYAILRKANQKLIDSNAKVVDAYIRGLNLEVAQANIANNKIIDANKKRIGILKKSFDGYKSYIEGGYKALIETTKNQIKSFASEIEAIEAGGKKFEQFIKSIQISTEKQIFEFELEDKSVSRQIDAVGEKYRETIERARATDLFDPDTAIQELNRARELATQGINLTRQVNKENKKVEAERTKLIKGRNKLEVAKQKIIDAYNLKIFNIESYTTKTIKERAKLKEDANKELAKQLEDNNNKQETFEKKLAGIKATNISQEFTDYKQVYEDLNDVIKGIRERQQEAEKKRIEELGKLKAEQIIKLAKLEKQLKVTGGFDLDKLLATGDIEAINKGISSYRIELEKLTRAQEALGLKVDTTEIEKQALAVEEAGKLTIANIRNEELKKAAEEKNKILIDSIQKTKEAYEQDQNQFFNYSNEIRKAFRELATADVPSSFFDQSVSTDTLNNLRFLAEELDYISEDINKFSLSDIEGFKTKLSTLEEALNIKVEGKKLAERYPELAKAYAKAINALNTKIDGKNLIDFIKQAERTKTKYEELKTKAEEFKEAQNGVNNSQETNLTLTQQLTTATDNYAEALERRNRAMKDAENIRALIDKTEEARQIAQWNRAFPDEPILRANGGRINGTDTVPAMLTPGEFVVNKHASQRFLSELTAMNSVRGYANGGMVTNNTQSIGDINVNLQSSGNSQVDVRRIASGIKREIRRGTISNF